jgi:hypothetical protein
MSNKVLSFFEKVGSALKKFFTNPTFEKQALATISYVAPLVESLVGLSAGTAAEQAVAGVIGQVEGGLATIAALVQDGTVAPGSPAGVTVATAANSVKENLVGLLTLAEVKNSAKAAQITSAVDLVVGELDALVANLPK